MADSEGAKDGLEEKAKEPQADSADVSENLRMKLTTMNNELQDTLKIVDSYKEDKRIAVNTKNELDESKKKISVLQTRLSESESNCRRYRNERNNLRQDIAKLIQERKQMISYEEDVQQLKREIEMQKNRYDRNDREWKNKQTEMENRYDEIINEQKQKIVSAEQEVQQLTKELELQKNAHEQDKRILESKQKESEETNHGEDKQDNNEFEQNEDVLERRDGKIKRNKLKGISDTNKYGYIGKSDLNESFEEGNKHFSDDNNDGPKFEETNQDTEEKQKNKSEQNEEVIEKRDVKIITHENVIENRKYDDIDGKEITERFEDSTTQLHDDNTGKPESEFVSEEPETNFDDLETIKKSKEKDKINDVRTDTTDPSDTILPKDLGVKYEELYKTQWSGAFENIRQHFDSEEETIEALLEILEDIMNFCKSKAQEQIDDLYRVLTFSADQEDGNVTDKITKHLKECMRELSCLAKEYLYGLYPLSLQKKSSRALQYLMDVEDFVKESFELLWLLVIQDPPVVFHPIAEKGDVLDLDIYKSYKTTGRYITFTVFPALLLHEDGPVLAMGVAEGDDQPKTKHKHDLRSRNTNTPKDVDQKIKDEHDYRDRDHYFRRDELKYDDRDDFVSRNKTLIRDSYDHSSKNEHGFDDIDDFVTGKEMRNGERDFISRDQDKFRNKVKFVPEDEMSFHDRGNVVSRHDMRFGDKDSRGQGNIDDFILHEETSVSDRDDFVRRDIKDLSKRVEFTSKDGGNYSDKGNFI
ncbi:golgin subfamily A member 6-like protein 22 [Mercenaria mercenaria]|uniref:golgin subfamily A member 6-like protein 22 n=1 Tax=Mercenaria mercenaria TaxID=6596 RepID=UPI00234ECC5D|nr:golgin subfamily A member 6-like protein 22 [Mercenaria mercenaria]XP_053399687.1 golgin subfamily A member 6-like protein 22 [Mercenaria mercenaria]